jgi:SWI/SNF-related matrix-associated actin-dependent regulator of chromatin subfamily A3
MGLGKTISIVSLMANTMDASRVFAFGPMKKITLRVAKTQAEAPPLTAANFAAQVWGMPDNAGDIDSNAEMEGASALGGGAGGKNGKGKGKRETQKEQLDAARVARIKAKSRATLIICPLSTIANWEDQFREHWAGEVGVVGGTSGSAPPNGSGNLVAAAKQLDLNRDRNGKRLKLYVYHGATRRPDVSFLADFDAVITTYSTLATEYSKQVKSSALYEDDGSGEIDARAAAEESGSESYSDEGGNPMVIKLKEKKPKKRPPGAALAAGLEISSPLQQIHWFRIVLDEAQ